jgi:hypothetical protein
VASRDRAPAAYGPDGQARALLGTVRFWLPAGAFRRRGVTKDCTTVCSFFSHLSTQYFVGKAQVLFISNYWC